MAPRGAVLQQHRPSAVGQRRTQQQARRTMPSPKHPAGVRQHPTVTVATHGNRIGRIHSRIAGKSGVPCPTLLEFAYSLSCERDHEGRNSVTLELAHPSTEPVPSQAPVDPVHPRWWFWTTTPGQILVSGVVLIALVALSAFATATTIDRREQTLTAVLNHAEPLAFAAGQLYTTLSVADAAAATAFIAGAEPREVRQRYEQAITNAAVALTEASGGLTDPALQELLSRINARLVAYTGLVETARTNNRAGNPVGSSYLSEASSLMQQQILPDAKRLYDETSARVDTQTTGSTDIPFLGILIVLATLLFGAYSNRWLARKTQRRLNFGFVAGGVAVVIMLVWVATVLTISTANSRSAKNTAAESLKTVTNLAIMAQQARADETLALIRRGDEDFRKLAYYQRLDNMHQLLDQYLRRKD